jgi:8-oxo-dGTP pyrophosphatase MutT (NUDIX family)
MSENCHPNRCLAGYGPGVAEPNGSMGVDGRPTELILAAGGVVLRASGSGAVEIALVHRPLREDWSYPKGKVEPSETLTGCALREVQEETGLRCRIVSFVGTTEYRDRKDRPKIVAYWAMTPVRGTFRSSEEVDQLRWVELSDAAELLTYERDRGLLDAVRAPAAWVFPRLRRSA